MKIVKMELIIADSMNYFIQFNEKNSKNKQQEHFFLKLFFFKKLLKSFVFFFHFVYFHSAWRC